VKHKAFLKMAALVSSVLLVGAFVSYRAGAFQSLLERNQPPVEAESIPEGELPAFYSSKSLRFTIPDAKNAPKEKTRELTPAELKAIIMSSSKLGIIAFDPPAPTGKPKPTPPATPTPDPARKAP
jgi:hypothetical protein